MTFEEILKLENQSKFFSDYLSNYIDNKNIAYFLSFIEMISDTNYHHNLDNGIEYETIGDYIYTADLSDFLFYSSSMYQNIIYQYFNLEYSDCDNKNPIFDRKKIIPFASDSSGRNLFYLSLLEDTFGQIIYQLGDYNFDFSFTEGTYLISKSFKEFIEKLLFQNQTNPEIYKLQEIYNELKEKGFK